MNARSYRGPCGQVAAADRPRNGAEYRDPELLALLARSRMARAARVALYAQRAAFAELAPEIQLRAAGATVFACPLRWTPPPAAAVARRRRSSSTRASA